MLAHLARLKPYLLRYRSKIAWGLIFITVSNICSTTIPHMVGRAVDALRADAYTQSDILILIAQILLLTIGSGLGMFATRRTIILMSRLVEEDLRNDFVSALSRQSQTFFHGRSTGSLLAHFSNDIGSVREFIGPAIMYTANTVTTFIFALSWMLSIDGWLTLAIVIPVPFISWATFSIGKKIHSRYKIVQEQYEHVTTHAQEAFSGIRVVKAYTLEESDSKHFARTSKDYYRKSMNLARVQSLMMPAMTVLFNLSYIVVVGYGGYRVVNHAITVGDLTQFFIYLNQLIWPVGAIGWVTGMIQRGAASLGRLGVILDSGSDITDDDNTNYSITRLSGHVRFSNVTLRYPNPFSPSYVHRDALKNVSVEVPTGASLGIMGSVGSGKSSFVNLIPRLYTVTSGTITIDGHDIRTIPLAVLRKHIAVVPQESFLFSDTLENNVKFGDPDANTQQTERAIMSSLLSGDLEYMEHGTRTMVGERGITLSGGQKQRTSLARALLTNPAILILDDALSAVDTHTEHKILEQLRHIMSDRTTFVVSHRVSALRHCDHIMVLHDGMVTEYGTHDELLSLNGEYAQVYGRQLLEEAIS